MDFLNAFQQAYEATGGEAVPSTMRETLEAARRWASGEGGAEPVVRGAQTVAEKASRNAQASQADLDANPELEAELREALERSRDAYGAAEQGLQELIRLVQAEDSAGVAGALPRLEELHREILEQGRRADAWLHAQVLRCPRCGSRGEEANCPSCGLDRLYPDPEFAKDRRVRVATLPPAFADVHRAYVGVLEGRHGLPPLLSSLEALEEGLRVKRSQADVLVRRMDSEAAAFLVSTLEDSLAGVARMRQVVFTRATRDLNAGWEMLFGSGGRVQQATAETLEEGGRGEQADQLKMSQRLTDMVILEGD